MSKVLFYLWRESPKQYVLDEVRDIDLTLYSSENFFSINNNGLSTFSIKKSVFDEETDLLSVVAWSAENEKKKPCTVKLIMFKKEERLEFQILYAEFMIVYRIN